ncbi:Lrp/AsnC family transcriptional regulator [uncultured Microbacterium sp.]|uniref:Lrp/AsnC family transcriptional regulator n=1 Tax=uncultured Microbacterium sp. TaxID=191216 RepID=UPI0025FF645D|nr:Lrp/AsnC family transcriptional regulator [uncultured Microbacterium sp.]
MIDEIAYDILRALRHNGRISIAALAQEVGISRASAYSRVESLTRAGIITGYTATVDTARLGLGVSALVFCTIQPQQWTSFLQAIGEMPDIESAIVMTGEHDVMLIVRSVDMEAMQSLVIGTIAARAEVTKVETAIVMGEVFRRPFVLPGDIPRRDPIGVDSGLMRFTRTDLGRGTRV